MAGELAAEGSQPDGYHLHDHRDGRGTTSPRETGQANCGYNQRYNQRRWAIRMGSDAILSRHDYEFAGGRVQPSVSRGWSGRHGRMKNAASASTCGVYVRAASGI